MRTVAVVCACLALLSRTSDADARDVDETWYGWQILVSGTVSLSLFGGGLALEDEVATPILVSVGALGYALGGPINHWARGHTAKGFGSLGLNVGLPTVAGLIGGGIFVAIFGEGGDVPSFPIGFVIGAGVGAGSAVIVDAVVLGSEPAAAPGAVSATITATPDGFVLGLSGRF